MLTTFKCGCWAHRLFCPLSSRLENISQNKAADKSLLTFRVAGYLLNTIEWQGLSSGTAHPAFTLHASRGGRRNSFHAPSPPPRNETGAGRRAGSAPDPALPSSCQAPRTSSPPEPALPAPVQPAARRRCSGRRRAGEKASDLEPRAAEHAQSAAEPGRLPARRWSVPPGVPGGRGAETADARPGTQLSPSGRLATGCARSGVWGILFVSRNRSWRCGSFPPTSPQLREEEGPRWWGFIRIRSPIRSQPESCAAKAGRKPGDANSAFEKLPSGTVVGELHWHLLPHQAQELRHL